MSTQYCAFCANPLPTVGKFCPSCGAAKLGGVSSPVSGPQPGFPVAFPLASLPANAATGGGLSGPSAATRPADTRALTRVAWAAVLALVGSVVGFAVTSETNLGGLIAVTSTTSGPAITLPAPWVWSAVLVSDAVIALTEIMLFRLAFRELAGVDHRFSTPATLALFALVGAVLAFAGAGLLLDAFYRAVQCDGSGQPITSGCLLTNTFWGGVALIGLGAVIAFIGYIGILLGIWRLGVRYRDALFKVSAILLIFPVLNIIAAALILIGARAERRQVQGIGVVFPPPT